MNILIPIAAAAAIAYSFSSKKSHSVKKSKVSHCEWLCGEVIPFAGINYKQQYFEYLEQLEIINKKLEKLGKLPSIIGLGDKLFEFGLQKYKCKGISSFTNIQYLRIVTLLVSAIYCVEKNIISNDLLALFLYAEFPAILVQMKAMTIGDYQSYFTNKVFENLLTDSQLTVFVKAVMQMSLTFENISAENIASLILIQLMLNMSVEVREDKCFKINNIYFTDYTALSGQQYPLLTSQYKRILNEVLLYIK